jgi:hypothetical protein
MPAANFNTAATGVNYYKVCVKRRNSDILHGTMSLAEYPI